MGSRDNHELRIHNIDGNQKDNCETTDKESTEVNVAETQKITSPITRRHF